MSYYPIRISLFPRSYLLWGGGFGSFHEWKEFAPQTLLRPTDIVFGERIIGWLPTVGGRPYSVDEPDEDRMAVLELDPLFPIPFYRNTDANPPADDVRISLRVRRAAMNADPNHVAPARRVAFVDTTYVRPRRGRSASRGRNTGP